MRRNFRSPARQTGLAAVETAMVGMLALVVLFAVFEIGRVFFVINALEEATRRGARVAAVCQLNDPAIREIAVFNNAGGGSVSPLVYGLTTANVAVEYLDDNGAVIADPAGNFLDIGFVRVGIRNYQHDLIIPLFMRSIAMPDFATTIPRESLGITREGFTTC